MRRFGRKNGVDRLFPTPLHASARIFRHLLTRVQGCFSLGFLHNPFVQFGGSPTVTTTTPGSPPISSSDPACVVNIVKFDFGSIRICIEALSEPLFGLFLGGGRNITRIGAFFALLAEGERPCHRILFPAGRDLFNGLPLPFLRSLRSACTRGGRSPAALFS